MQKETERQKYMAEFSKLRNCESETVDYVRVIQTSEFGYSIITGHNYNTVDMPDDWTDQTITCKFPATAGWIYDNCRSICNACGNGEILKDIPFDNE